MNSILRRLRATLPLLFIVLALLAIPALAAPSGEGKAPDKGSDADEIKAMVKKLDAEPERIKVLAQSYQDDPYGPRAMATGALLLRYMMDTNKVSLLIDRDVIAPLLADEKSDANMRLFFLYSNALLVYALDHGNRADLADGSTRAGLEGVVAGYKNMLRLRPKEHNAFGDKLLDLAARGGLDAYIRETRTKATPTPKPN